jgi:cytochrome P450
LTVPAGYFCAPVFAAPATSPVSFRMAKLLRTDLVGSFPRTAYEQDYVVQHLFGLKRILLNKPEAIRHVLMENHDNCCRLPASQRMLRPMLGNGLLISEGESWRHQQGTIAPALAPRVIPMMARVMVGVPQDWTAEFAKVAVQPVDVLRQMRLLALDIAERTMFSIDTGEDGQELRTLLEYFTGKIGIPHLLDFLLLPGIPTPYDFVRRRLRARMMRVVERIMDRRLKQPPGQHARDLLGLLVAARDPETAEAFSCVQLRGQVTTMLVAGHETTGLAPF